MTIRRISEPESPRDVAEVLAPYKVRSGESGGVFSATATKPGMRGFYTGQGATKVEALRDLARAIKRG